MEPASVDRELIFEVLDALVSIDSVNPAFPGADGGPGRGEGTIAAYARKLLEGLGLETHLYEATPGRPSVVGVLRGNGGGRSLMLNGHLDTVGPGAMSSPFVPRVENGRLYGRGAYDMKGAVAACIGVVQALSSAEERPAGDVVLALVADEEHRSLGIQEVLRHHATDGAIVAEPTEMALSLAHKGFVWLSVTTRGVACHGSDHRRGVDANLRMVRVLAPLVDLQEQLPQGDTHPLLGPMSLHLGRLEGGDGPSIYAARCRGEIELRTIPGEASRRALDAIGTIVDRARARMTDPSIELDEDLVRPPFEAMPGSRLASEVETAGIDVLGSAPDVVGVPFWTDAAFVREQGIDTVLFGPAGAGAHADEEWVDLESVYDCAAVLARVAHGYCNGRRSG